MSKVLKENISLYHKLFSTEQSVLQFSMIAINNNVLFDIASSLHNGVTSHIFLVDMPHIYFAGIAIPTVQFILNADIHSFGSGFFRLIWTVGYCSNNSLAGCLTCGLIVPVCTIEDKRGTVHLSSVCISMGLNRLIWHSRSSNFVRNRKMVIDLPFWRSYDK